jgi:putative membrane protein
MEQPTTLLAKKLTIYAWIVTIIVFLAVPFLHIIKTKLSIDLGFDVHYIPMFYATCNALTALCLLAALYFVKQKDIVNHKRMTTSAMLLSALFLLGYVAYHALAQETKYGDTNHNHVVDAAELAAVGGWRTFYFFFLNTHIVSAALILPFVFFTYIRGLTHQTEAHRKMAKYTFPVWLYVAVSGVICYLMISAYYPA